MLRVRQSCLTWTIHITAMHCVQTGGKIHTIVGRWKQKSAELEQDAPQSPDVTFLGVGLILLMAFGGIGKVEGDNVQEGGKAEGTCSIGWQK